jgi:hypothetical protein
MQHTHALHTTAAQELTQCFVFFAKRRKSKFICAQTRRGGQEPPKIGVGPPRDPHVSHRPNDTRVNSCAHRTTALQRRAALSLEATEQLIKEQDFFVYRLTRANETKKYKRALIWGATQEELQTHTGHNVY